MASYQESTVQNPIIRYINFHVGISTQFSLNPNNIIYLLSPYTNYKSRCITRNPSFIGKSVLPSQPDKQIRPTLETISCQLETGIYISLGYSSSPELNLTPSIISLYQIFVPTLKGFSPSFVTGSMLLQRLTISVLNVPLPRLYSLQHTHIYTYIPNSLGFTYHPI